MSVREHAEFVDEVGDSRETTARLETPARLQLTLFEEPGET